MIKKFSEFINENRFGRNIPIGPELNKELQFHFLNNESLKEDILWMFDKLYDKWCDTAEPEDEDAFVDMIVDDYFWENDTEIDIRNKVLDYLKDKNGDGWDNQTASRMYEIYGIYVEDRKNNKK